MLSLPTRRRVLVTGAAGQVGTAFRRQLVDASFLTRSDLDLSDIDSIPNVIERYHPSAVVNCAAYTNVDRAESEEGLATRINGEAVSVLAQSCADLAVPFVTFSTDYVFDGTASSPYLESDCPDPVGAYGRSKRLGEQLALAAYPGTLIVRTSWVISATHDNFVATILRLARRGSFKVVDDQHGKPTVAADLAAATTVALERGLTGILHLANEGETTWYQLASTAVHDADLDPSLVEPCETDEFPTPATRPAYSVLGTERDDAPQMPSWESSLPLLVAAQLLRASASESL